MTHRRTLAAITLLVAASLTGSALAACARPTPPDDAPQAVATPAQAPAALPEASPAAAEPTNAAPEAPPTLDAAQLIPVGMLESFQRQIREVVAMQGQQATTMTAELRFAGGPQAVYHARTCAGGDEASLTCSEYVCAGGYEYVRGDGSSWTRRAVPATEPDPLLILSTADIDEPPVLTMGLLLVRPEATLLGATGRYVGAETVAGVDSWHYEYDSAALEPTLLARALAGSEMNAGQVDLWVSADTRVAMRLIATLEIRAGSNPGKLELEMDTSDVNAPLQIEVPTEFSE